MVHAFAETLDPGAQHVARPQVNGRLPGVPHSAGGAGGEQVARPQGDHLARVGDDLRRAEQQANRLTQVQTGTGSTCTSPTTVGTYTYDGTGNSL